MTQPGQTQGREGEFVDPPSTRHGPIESAARALANESDGGALHRPDPHSLLSHDGLATTLRWGLLAAALLPPLYLFLAIQYSAVTHPFWDHTDLLRSLAPLYDGQFQISSLWAPHNHSRPLTLRLIYLANARLTGWDIRSEYIYMYATIYGTFALQLSILWRLTGRRLTLVFGSAALVLSIVYFSPAGHMNHWWSMMLQLNLANLLIVYAVWRLAQDPTNWLGNILAATTGWAATYTLTNGLVAMIVLAVIAQISRPRPLAMGRQTIFWTLNLATIFILYFHGLPSEAVPHPGPVDLARFALVYLGAPLGDLVHFPFQGNFDVPTTTWFNGLFGVVLVVLAATLLVSAWRRIRAGDPAALMLLGFTLFGVGSALTTAWGRARLDETGVAQANTSRYTIFGSFLVYGLILYIAALVARGEWRSLVPPRLVRRGHVTPRRAAMIGAGTVLAISICGSVAYESGIAAYRAAHAFNRGLSAAYALTPDARQLDGWIYAFPERSEEVKAELLRLKIGPYRGDVTYDSTVLAKSVTGAPRSQVDINPGMRLYQEFTAREDHLAMISIQATTPSGSRSGSLRWTLFDLDSGARVRVGNAAVSLDGARSRGNVGILVGDLGRSAKRRFGLLVAMPATSGTALRIPLFDRPPRARVLGPVAIDGRNMPRLTPRIVLSYLK